MNTLYSRFYPFWNNETEFMNIDQLEEYIKKKYNVSDTYMGNKLFKNDHISLCPYKSSNDTLNFYHNKENICLLFPEDGLRIVCTRNFIKNVPFIEQKLSGSWNDKIMQKKYYCKILNEIVNGSINIEVRTSLESILYDTPIKCKIRDDDDTFREITCNTLEDSIILNNNENWYKNI